MKYLRISVLMALMFSFLSGGQAQDKFGMKIKLHHREDSGASYNFFVGDDAKDFQTSINGFGSGFLFDALTSRNSLDFLALGTKTGYLSLGAGFAINKYRFKDNLVLSLSEMDNKVVYEVDPDPDHDYVNTFFGYGKSKLVTGSVFVPLHLNLVIAKKILLSAGGFVDFYVYGKHKRKYLNDGEKEKALIEPKDFKNYNLNKVKYGVSASIMHKETGIGLVGTYYLTPFFQEGMGPDLNEARISLVFSANPRKFNRE